MQVTVDVAGGETHVLDVDDGATYGDVLEPLEYGRHEVTVLVDGRSVPTDAPVTTDAVRVVRLVAGG